MGKANIRPLLIIFLALVTGIVLFGGRILQSQDIDPFYVKLFNQGEKSFLAGDYEDAVEELEIAVFGLFGEKKLMAKAYIYLSVSYYYLKDMDRSEGYLREADDLIGEEGFEGFLESLEIDESVRPDIEKLIVRFKPGETQEQGAEGGREIFEKTGAEIKKMEEDIKKQPQNISLYYELYEVYENKKDIKKAKKVLERLVKKNPNEEKGIFLLGKVEFLQKRYKKALQRFGETMVTSDESLVDRELKLKAMIYTCLCLHHLKKKEDIKRYLNDLYEAGSEREIQRILREEGLERQWDKIS